MQLFITHISQFNDLAGIDLLDGERKVKTLGYAEHDDMVKSLVAGLLLRYCFGEKVKKIILSPYGKPYIPNEKVFFNLSHGGEYVALAVDFDEIGVDVEPFVVRAEGLAKRVCKSDELEWLSAQADPNAFYRIWAGKESVMKACGKGYLLSPSSFSVAPPLDGLHVIDGKNWYLSWYGLENHALCVASKTEERIEPIFLDRETLLNT